MKKTIALITALLLVLSFAACGSAEPEPLPLPASVKFGNVTEIEKLENNAESIVLSMDDPSSSKGAERDVYIATIDYIFTHAPKNLETLSVSAYDPSGNIIISFTLPSNLIAHLRKVESEGSWGTAGFAAYYYMNQGAYDALVMSIEAANK